MCARCGLSEMPRVPEGYDRLTGLAAVLTHDAYKLRQALTRKKLGIDL